MWADKVRYGFAGFRSTASPDRIAKSPVVDIAHARFRKNDCRVPQEKFRVQDSRSTVQGGPRSGVEIRVKMQKNSLIYRLVARAHP